MLMLWFPSANMPLLNVCEMMHSSPLGPGSLYPLTLTPGAPSIDPR
jgi:hypothetical protein